MPRYTLRTLLILLAIGPPVLAGVWWAYKVDDELTGTAGSIVVLVVAVWLGARVLAKLP